jgi:hypothetical protein
MLGKRQKSVQTDIKLETSSGSGPAHLISNLSGEGCFTDDGITVEHGRILGPLFTARELATTCGQLVSYVPGPVIIIQYSTLE